MISQVGTPDDLYWQPRNSFVASFVGRGSILKGVAIKKNEDQMEIQLDGCKGTFLIAGAHEVGEHLVFTVKPEGIRIGVSDDDAMVATIHSLTHHLGGYRIELEIGNQIIFTFIPSDAILKEMKRGSSVPIRIDPQKVVVLSE